LKDKPEEIINDDYVTKLYEQMRDSDDEIPDTYNIVQITDWHVDLRYKVGSNRKCLWEICCSEEFGMAKNEDEYARPYGELTCDIPF
jgi:hypothetical protein